MIMAITNDELAARLAAEAARRGLSAEHMDKLADAAPVTRRRLGFVGLGASTSGRPRDR